MSTSNNRSKATIVSALVASTALLISACEQPGSTMGEGVSEPHRLETSGSEVIADADKTGVEVSARLFETSDAVVVSSEQRDDQLRAAALASSLAAPLLVRVTGADAAVDAEIERLGAERVIDVPSDNDALDGIEPLASANQESDVKAIASLQPQNASQHVMPPVMVTAATSLAAATTARARGAELHVLQTADPRVTSDSIRTVMEQDTLALGNQWGSSEDYTDRVELAKNGELPGGGGLVFPGRRMVALYGHSLAPELGIMGEHDPEQAAALATNYAEQYQPMEDSPVIPAFEIIVTVASESPGEDGDYSNEAAIDSIEPYVDAITQAGGYAVLDLQPGQGDFLHQVELYEELLKRPNVGLALDAEWKISAGEKPLSRVGSATAEEVNEVATWLAQLTRDNNLPQKAFVLHQFQVGMFPDRENFDTDHPELAFVLHADGHGTPEEKFGTWDLLRQGLDPSFFMAWKNFFDEDTPAFTPEQTYQEVNPRPWFISYQ